MIALTGTGDIVASITGSVNKFFISYPKSLLIFGEDTRPTYCPMCEKMLDTVVFVTEKRDDMKVNCLKINRLVAKINNRLSVVPIAESGEGKK
jgi:hypothetical protein